MLCRFYRGYTLEEIGNLTVSQFSILMDNMVKILEMENPDPNKPKRIGDPKKPIGMTISSKSVESLKAFKKKKRK